MIGVAGVEGEVDARRRCVQPTDNWAELEPLLQWPEQVEYEKIRPPLIFGSSVAERAREVGVSERMLYYKIERFDAEGVPRLFSKEEAKRRVLPPAIREMIVSLNLDDRPRGRPPGVRKVDLATIEMVRRLQENPELGEFRIHAELVRRGKDISRRTVGNILALNRRVHGMNEPKRSPTRRRRCLSPQVRHHQYWSADVRYIKKHRLGGRVYVISISTKSRRANPGRIIRKRPSIFRRRWPTGTLPRPRAGKRS